MASSNRQSPTHRTTASSRRNARVAPLPSWRRVLPATDTMLALFALAAALVVFADFAATF